MKIEIIDPRYIVGIGFKTTGDIIGCSKDLGEQLIYQGVAKNIPSRLVKKEEQKEGA